MTGRIYRFLSGTLRGRLIVGVAAVHALMMSVFLVDLTVRQRAMLLDRQSEEATALSQSLATSSAGWIAANDVSGLQELVEAQRRYPELLFALLADRDGRVLADTDGTRKGQYLQDLPDEPRQVVLSVTPALVDVATPAMIGEHQIGWARVGIGQEVADQKLAEITRDGVAYALAAVLLGSLMSWYLGLKITRRLYAVQGTMDAVRAGDRTARCHLDGTDEAASLAREFNGMLDVLGERDAERRQAELTLQRVNRELEAISSCNQVLLRAEDEQSLIDAICRIATEEAGYCMAWVGYAEHDEARTLRPMARAGRDDGYLEEARFTWADNEFGRTPAGAAVRTGQREYLQDFAEEHEVYPWRAGALRRGYRSAIALPLKGETGDTFGVLCLYSTEAHAFTEKEIRLLEELAGDLAFGITVIRGVTERARLEEQLRQSQKMESVGRLAGGVAHDFNNMLMVILGRVEQALEEVEPGHPVRGALEQIQQAAERSADLARQLLAFARKQVIEPRVLDLNETVEATRQMLRHMVGEGVDLAWAPGEGLWSVRVDPTQVVQILANLCVNARDAVAGEGRVTLETRNIVLDEASLGRPAEVVPGEYVLLAVTDDGCGMDRETSLRIFEPFFTTKPAGQGTGLGLAVVYGIVKQNRGFLNVYSEPGHGSTFKVYLPRHVAQAGERREEEPPPPPVGGHETILIVEDEPAILELARGFLEKLGYRVLTAGAPAEALRVAAESPGPIHLLLSDVVMPEMNGRELARKVAALHPGLRNLFMSGYAGDLVVLQELVDEGGQFLQKPFSSQALALKVREALEARSALPSG